MPRLKPVDMNRLSPSVKIALERHLQQYGGSVTGIKAALGYSLPAFEAYMYWYPLFDEVERILGKGCAAVYAAAVCQASECSSYASFFKQLALENEMPVLGSCLAGPVKKIHDFGTAVVKYNGNIADHIYNTVAAGYSEQDMVVLISFAGLMSAACIFYNTVEVEEPAAAANPIVQA